MKRRTFRAFMDPLGKELSDDNKILGMLGKLGKNNTVSCDVVGTQNPPNLHISRLRNATKPRSDLPSKERKFQGGSNGRLFEYRFKSKKKYHILGVLCVILRRKVID